MPSKWDCFIWHFRFLLCCDRITHWWRQIKCVSPSSVPWETDLVQSGRRTCGVHDHCHKDRHYPTTGRMSKLPVSRIWLPSFFSHLPLSLLRSPASHLFLLYLSSSGEGCLVCCEEMVQGFRSCSFWRLPLQKAVGICNAASSQSWSEQKCFQRGSSVWHLPLWLRGIWRDEVSVILTDWEANPFSLKFLLNANCRGRATESINPDNLLLPPRSRFIVYFQGVAVQLLKSILGFLGRRGMYPSYH